MLCFPPERWCRSCLRRPGCGRSRARQRGDSAGGPARPARPRSHRCPVRFFLLLLGGVSFGISLFASGYFRDTGGTALGLLALQYHVFLASMAFVLIADDAYLFMITWESMALSSYFLVTTEHHNEQNRKAGFIYLLIAHIGAISILLCFGVLHGGHGDYTFEALRAESEWLLATVAFLGNLSARRQGRCAAARVVPGRIRPRRRQCPPDERSHAEDPD